MTLNIEPAPIAPGSRRVACQGPSQFIPAGALDSDGTLAAPSTAFVYDGLGIMPLWQQFWLRHLETYKQFPPLQAPETYNLDQVMAQLKSAAHPSD
jgi:hypothetical protein